MTSRIKGPGGPGGPRGVDGVDGADEAEGAGEVRSTERAGEAKGAPSTDAVAKVAQQLKSGAISAERAVELLIEHTVSSQGAATPAMRARLQKVLERYVKDDPLLAGRIKRLGLRK